MSRKLDVLFVHPGASEIIYQDLSKNLSAVETPTWSLLLASSCRKNGFGTQILDCDAERLSCEVAAKRIKEINPRLVCFVVYGQNPNAGTTKMTGAIETSQLLEGDFKICFVGSHVSALPLSVLSYGFVDFVLLNEGVYALNNLLKTDLKTDLQNVKGIGWKDGGNLRLNEPEQVVPNDKMDQDLPGYAWDLLPRKEKAFDLYRSCNWHANFKEELRSPYAAIYTSLGCRFKCSFCMINIVNRVNNNYGISAADSPNMRFWSPDFMLKQIDGLVSYGVNTIRLSDEMFFLDKRYFEPLLNKIVERGYKDLLMWAYARVDTVRPKYLELFEKAGIKWLALGIEAANQKIRKEITKGTYQEINIKDVVKSIRESGISVISNYIFGLPDDDYNSMNETLDLALELNTEMANMYPCFALPGSPLHVESIKNNVALPNNYSAWSFHSYDCLPLPTKHLSAAEVLKFRDNAWKVYFNRPEYLSMVESKFGVDARNNIEHMTKYKLKRKLLGD